MKVVKVIRLPIVLPTWNRLLGVNHWQRRKIRHAVHDIVSIFIPEGKERLTQTEYQEKLQLMDSSLQEYSKMIRPSSSKKSATARKKSSRVKRKRRSSSSSKKKRVTKAKS